MGRKSHTWAPSNETDYSVWLPRQQKWLTRAAATAVTPATHISITKTAEFRRRALTPGTGGGYMGWAAYLTTATMVFGDGGSNGRVY